MNKCKMNKIIRAYGFTPHYGAQPDLPEGTRVAVIMRGEVANVEKMSPDTLNYATRFHEWGWGKDNSAANWDIVGYKVIV